MPQAPRSIYRQAPFSPATGPYMIRSYTPMETRKECRPTRHERLELVRNPKFDVWSPAAQPAGFADRTVLETGLHGERGRWRG